MSFILAHPPPPREHPEEDSLASALHAAFQSFTSSSQRDRNTSSVNHGPLAVHPTFIPLGPETMKDKTEKHQPTLDILVNSETLYLRGIGVDVNPALLSGNVVLQLYEPTSLKQIVLSFKGKAKIPAAGNDAISLQSNHLQYLVCSHDWAFLEGSKGHSHTLKAGRHLFPFQLHLGGSLPCSISTSVFGGAAVSYKLRATAIRSGFSLTHRDISAACPIHIHRTFGSEALEYQQTLEIENTWPEKLMYSIMLPHKAWAAGESVTAVVKFSPLVKGARVLNVTTNINETVKLYTRLGPQEATRSIATARHDIVDGHAVLIEEQHHRYRIPLLHSSQPVSPHSSTSPSTAQFPNSSTGSYFPPVTSASGDMSPLTSPSANSSASNVALSRVGSNNASNQSHPPVASGSTQPASSTSQPQLAGAMDLPPEFIPHDEDVSNDVVTTLNIAIPTHTTPSHGLEPIQISHRIRWSILIGNKDGHTSELRCSLPIHILDHSLIEEARAATLATRRLLLGSQDIEGGEAVGTNGANSDIDDDLELPSYPQHVRDRVANAFLPENATMRVTNPWVAQGVSPVINGTESPSGDSRSPQALEAHPISSRHSRPAPRVRDQLPPNPQPSTAAQSQLDWVNSELLLSLTQNPEMLPAVSSGQVRSPIADSTMTSAHASRFPSRRGSRANSRAASPERDHHHAPSISSSHHQQAAAVVSPAEGVHGPHGHGGDTFVHSSSTASRHLQAAVTNASGGNNHLPTSTSSIGPITTTTTTTSLPDGSGTRTSTRPSSGDVSPAISPEHILSSRSSSSLQIAPLSTTARPTTQDPRSGPMLLHRAFTETPDYEMASRGFLGGGIPPLDSLRDLPSYEDAVGVCGSGGDGGAHDRRSSRVRFSLGDEEGDGDNESGLGQRVGDTRRRSDSDLVAAVSNVVSGMTSIPSTSVTQTAPPSPRP
ncbi:hypothetical protein ABKN59_005704 [Abortiporus biennis]